MINWWLLSSPSFKLINIDYWYFTWQNINATIMFQQSLPSFVTPSFVACSSPQKHLLLNCCHTHTWISTIFSPHVQFFIPIKPLKMTDQIFALILVDLLVIIPNFGWPIGDHSNADPLCLESISWLDRQSIFHQHASSSFDEKSFESNHSFIRSTNPDRNRRTLGLYCIDVDTWLRHFLPKCQERQNNLPLN